jgi:hypothetical protein
MKSTTVFTLTAVLIWGAKIFLSILLLRTRIKPRRESPRFRSALEELKSIDIAAQEARKTLARPLLGALLASEKSDSTPLIAP